MTVRVENLLTKQVHLVQKQDLEVVFMEEEEPGRRKKTMFGVKCILNKRQLTIVSIC